MTKKEKYRLLLLMAGIAMLLLILAAGISRFKMLPGHPFPIEWKSTAPGAVGTLGSGNWFLVLLRGFLILLIIIIPIYIFINLLTPQGRRRLLKGFIQLMVMVFLLYILVNLANSIAKQNQQGTLTPEPGTPVEGGLPPEGFVTTPQPVNETTPSPLLDVGICLGLAFILATIITVLAWGIYRASRERTGDAIARLADEAQEALDAIQAGGDIRETVIRCYIKMTQIVAAERNVRREEAMTPHEFAQILLKKMRLPESPVQHLTSLFEAVRYGDYHPGKREELEAIDSLTAIAAACKNVT